MKHDDTHALCRVDFEETGKFAMVGPGSTIMEAARKAGVHIDTACGGTGACGKCTVLVTDGSVVIKPGTVPDENQKRNGYVLACRAEILSDLRVSIPEESRLEGKPRFDPGNARILDALPDNNGKHSLTPLCRKVYLELPKPSLDDCVSDIDRVRRALDNAGYVPVLRSSLPVIRSLPGLLRESDYKITATLASGNGGFAAIRFEAGDAARNYGIAVDIGTTTVMASLLDLRDGTRCGSDSAYNSQIRYGDDVITRIVHTQEHPDGLAELASAVVADINGLIDSLIRKCGVSRDEISCMVCTGNTVMIHALLGLPMDNIRREPYIPAVSDPPTVRAAEIGIDIAPGGIIGFLPGPGAYVGSDITAAVLASGMAAREEIGLLIDVGTNGEIVLGNRDWLICCSASAGPAFEGAGTRCGMRASPGAIEKVRLFENGLALSIIGGENQKPRGICGSGYIDLLAELFLQGILDRTGRFKSGVENPRLRRGKRETEFLLWGKNGDRDGKDIVIAESDIASLIRTKGALYTAAETILRHVGLDWADIGRIYISGGFGNHLDARRSVVIGLLPDVDMEKFRFIGNGSIAGAELVLLSAEARRMAETIAAGMTYHDLSTDPGFMDRFTSSLFLPHTDLEKFPSVVPVEELEK